MRAAFPRLPNHRVDPAKVARWRLGKVREFHRLRRAGFTWAEAASACCVPGATISRWVLLHRELGLAGLRTKYKAGTGRGHAYALMIPCTVLRRARWLASKAPRKAAWRALAYHHRMPEKVAASLKRGIVPASLLKALA
jgi:hypothetical protein